MCSKEITIVSMTNYSRYLDLNIDNEKVNLQPSRCVFLSFFLFLDLAPCAHDKQVQETEIPGDTKLFNCEINNDMILQDITSMCYVVLYVLSWLYGS